MIIPLRYTTLFGRGNGEVMDRDLRPLLLSTPCLTLDFQGVTLMDGVFADAAFGVLAGERSTGAFSGGALVFAHMNSDVMRNLGMALICRAAETSTRNCIVLTCDINGQFSLLGKSEQHVFDTWTWLQQCPSLTTPALADKLNLSPSAASTRLKWLHTLGLCLRTEERSEAGRQFVYHRIQQERL